MKADVTVTDITKEAKEILAPAMNNFCKVTDKEQKEKEIYLAARFNYWLSIGYSVEFSNKKANEDYEWTK